MDPKFSTLSLRLSICFCLLASFKRTKTNLKVRCDATTFFRQQMQFWRETATRQIRCTFAVTGHITSFFQYGFYVG